MMKALSIAISSPGLPEKFPPPLKKLSRNNVGSSSSKSLRSSPIFYRRNAAGMTINNTAQEPYSPRVTCIGQVRPRKTVSRRRSRCWFLKGKFLSRFTRFMCKWVVFCKACYCKKVDIGRKIEFLSGDCENSINHVEVRVGDSCCSDPPPRNALMLTRFGRASSLGERIWREKGGNDGVAQSTIGQESGQDSENLRNINVGDLEGTRVTRCNSEPARRGDIKV